MALTLRLGKGIHATAEGTPLAGWTVKFTPSIPLSYSATHTVPDDALMCVTSETGAYQIYLWAEEDESLIAVKYDVVFIDPANASNLTRTASFSLPIGGGGEVYLPALFALSVDAPDDNSLGNAVELVLNESTARYRTISGTTGTLAETDLNRIVQTTSGSAVALTVANSATLGTGFVCAVLQKGAGAVTLTPAGGVTLNGASSSIVIAGGIYHGVTIVQAVDSSNAFVADAYIVLGSI